MNLKFWSLTTCAAGWICLIISYMLTRVFHTDQWLVVIPLTVHLFSFLVLAWAIITTTLWMIQMGRWQEDMAVASINLLLASMPVIYIVAAFYSQPKSLTRFVLSLMWTGS